MDRRLFVLSGISSFVAACGSGSSAPESITQPVALPPPPVVCRTRPVSNGVNIIIDENKLQGTSSWQITKGGWSGQIEGYASATSVNVGESIDLMISTDSASYSLDVYRLGWYNGDGARLMFSTKGLVGQKQAFATPTPSLSADCSWVVSQQLNTSGYVSGVYIVKLTTQEGFEQYITFIVRDDSRIANIVYQSSTMTSQAYNEWGGKSLYSANGSTAVSVNRPYYPSISSYGAGQVFGWDIKLIRFLEKNGYDVTYEADSDLHNRAPLNTRCVLIAGHSEYWTQKMRENIELAASNGVNILVIGSNTCYWNASLQGRTIQCTRKSNALYGATNPEEKFFGSTYTGQLAFSSPVDFVLADAPSWLLAGTSLKSGDKISGVFGYEGDQLTSNSPSNIVVWGKSSFVDYNEGKTKVGVSTMYSGTSKLNCSYEVINLASAHWAFGLDDTGFKSLTSVVNSDVQTITKNMLNRLTS
jgi:hypothetical protein